MCRIVILFAVVNFFNILQMTWKTFVLSSNQKNVKSAVSVLSSTSSSFGNAAASSKFDTSNGIDEQLKAQALAEEEAVLNQYKVEKTKDESTFFLIINWI